MKTKRIWSLTALCAVLFIGYVAFHVAWVVHDTALYRAVGASDIERVRLLLRRGANINEPSRMNLGWTPLIAAVYKGDTNMVHYLIDAGADINLGGRDGDTPLIWAVRHQNIPMINDLIAHGANASATDRSGISALDYAKSAPQLLDALKSGKTPER